MTARKLLTAVVAGALVGLLGTFAGARAGSSAGAPPGLPYHVPTGWVTPNPVNDLDCNGWSAAYRSARPAMKMDCVDPVAPGNNGWGDTAPDGRGVPFYDNGHYVGHDEPSVRFLSATAGSANTFTAIQQLPRDPAAAPNASPTAPVTDYAQLSPAPWYGLPICDTYSYPSFATLYVNPSTTEPGPHYFNCTPDSDSNAPNPDHPLTTGSGSAFMELQFYPPGFGPFIDAPSCSPTQWCAAMTIDSFELQECGAGNPANDFGSCVYNPNCIEPINFSYLQTNGAPAGPPSPQLQNTETFNGDANTLKMNPGDALEVSISENPGSGADRAGLDTGGLEAKVTDLTTGQTGFIVASAHNGFMHTNPADCTGKALSFHAEYNTARAGHTVPWAALEGGVLMEQEIGHFETCQAVVGGNNVVAGPYTSNSGAPEVFTDPLVQQTCLGGYEGSGLGEGVCEPGIGCALSQGVTEGGAACTTGTEHCESSDGFCMPAGPRPVVNGDAAPEVWTWPVAACEANQYQNGDLDYDGNSYWPDWPNGSTNLPTSFRYIGPFLANGQPYPKINFETDGPGSENDCNPAATTPTGAPNVTAIDKFCTVPPSGAKFYPFWSLSSREGIDGTNNISGECVWNFGNDIAGLTTQDFGGSSHNGQYGQPDVSRYAGTLITGGEPNPEVTGACAGLTLSKVLGSR